VAERRYTDRDVALILRRAAEIDRKSTPDAPVRGLSVGELQEIAGEVGINPEAVTRAAAEFEGRRGLEPATLLGPGQSLGELVRTVDQQISAQGSVSEALGSVRWSSSGRFLRHQVSFEPSRDETIVRVEERYEGQVRTMIHAIPTAYAAMIGLVLGIEGIGGAVPGVLLALFFAALAWVVGGFIWGGVSRRSGRRAHELADTLVAEASRLPAAGEMAAELPASPAVDDR
jgi:hypothetical protein